MKSRIFAAFLSVTISLQAAINISVDTTDTLSGDFQVALGTSETFTGVDLLEINEFGLDGVSGFFMALFVDIAGPSSDLTLVEYVQEPGDIPAVVFSGSEFGTISAAQTGGRAIDYSFTDVQTDASTIIGNFTFTAVPESSQWSLIVGTISIGMIALRRRR